MNIKEDETFLNEIYPTIHKLTGHRRTAAFPASSIPMARTSTNRASTMDDLVSCPIPLGLST